MIGAIRQSDGYMRIVHTEDEWDDEALRVIDWARIVASDPSESNLDALKMALAEMDGDHR